MINQWMRVPKARRVVGAVALLVVGGCASASTAGNGVARAASTSLPAANHTLLAGPTTVAWGNYDAAATPVLRIKSGDVVDVGTFLTSNPTRLEASGVKPADVEQALRDTYRDHLLPKE